MLTKGLNADKPEQVFLTAKNAESSSSIAAGNNVALVMNATDDGLAIVLPATAAAAKTPALFYGVATGAIAAGATGKVQVFGFCRNAVVLRATRAASTDVWASTAAGAVGDPLIVNTANNCLARQAIPSSYVTGTAASDTLALNLAMFAPFAVLAETLVSATTVASTSSNANTASTSSAKVFLRAL